MNVNILSPILPSPPPPSPQHSSPKFNIPFVYYGLAIIGAAALVLVLYNLIIVRCFPNNNLSRSHERTLQNYEPSSSRSFDNPNIRLVLSFKYKKEKVIVGLNDKVDYECPICLTMFEEGEEVKQLPRCKHSFHASCIDMWIYSHVNCPVCRASIESSVLQRNLATDQVPNVHGGV